MSDERFILCQDDFGNYEIRYDEEVFHFLWEVAPILNEQQATIITLKRRLEKINGGYGHLTHRNGLTANEWVIESQERELQKKNEQISDWIERHSKDIAKIGEQKSTISQLEEENEQLKQQLLYDGDDVCSICKHEYLVPSGDYFIGKCEKGHEECSKEDIEYCEDFKLKEAE